MNEKQNMVIATAVAGFLLIILFLCPWRVESTGEIEWSPIYQEPATYSRSYNTDYGPQGSTRLESTEAEIVYGYLALEVLALLVASGVLYLWFSDPDDAGTPSPNEADQT